MEAFKIDNNTINDNMVIELLKNQLRNTEKKLSEAHRRIGALEYLIEKCSIKENSVKNKATIIQFNCTSSKKTKINNYNSSLLIGKFNKRV